MSKPVIKVEQLSKKFILSHEVQERYTSLRDVMAKKARGIFGRNKGNSTQHATEEFFALKDINFEVSQGDRIGVIGRNGAGKSTLLKLLSRITEPTSGRITVRGRVASLLEVGTGFHPELSGRENVFLNGAILGMSRSEIRRKFDEIVAFAEVEKFLDTPVKRYSSGMYVRLAFAVAAHLEPEILIIDEVLAVGDAQFQKKCLGKMEDVSKNEGRTILFVSHNMGVISQLCKSAILLRKGHLEFTGSVSQAIESYISNSNSKDSLRYTANKNAVGKAIFIQSAEVVNREGNISENILISESVYIKLSIGINHYDPAAKLSVTLQSMVGDYLSTFVENLEDFYNEGRDELDLTIKLPENIIAPNHYALRFAIFVPNGRVYDLAEMVCPFRIVDSGSKMAMFEDVNYGSFILNHEVIR